MDNLKTSFDPSAFLQDPLSTETRRERRNLLIASFLGMLVSYAQVLPKKISFLGVDMDIGSQKNLVVMLVWLLSFFWVALLYYGTCDLGRWVMQVRAYKEWQSKESENWSHEEQIAWDEFKTSIPPGFLRFQNPIPLSTGRFAFDFLVPLAFGAIAVVSLLCFNSSLVALDDQPHQIKAKSGSEGGQLPASPASNLLPTSKPDAK